ncbi:MAG: hypothetical protein HRK26_05110 [Rickettsiaceae bacterium H1]|nr:hypothetical protein [Rickettsiaceae bacterium H1]
MRVGLLGGSFDPSHQGHVFISLRAIKYFNLNQIWWLITEKNTLKKQAFYLLKKRLEIARNQVKKIKKIKVFIDRENKTYKTVKSLKEKFGNYRFVWITGIDCFINFHKWYRSEDINRLIPILAFNREKLIHKAIKSKFITRFIKNNTDICNFSLLGKKICILKTKINNLSSTKIKDLNY